MSMGMRRALELLREAREALGAARAELEEASRTGDSVKLRKACEAAWLATVKAVDALLEASGLGNPIGIDVVNYGSLR